MKKVIHALSKNQWIISLITTTVGVYLGIFVSDYYAKQSAIEKTARAFERVKTELVDNHEIFLEWDSISRVNYDAFEFIMNNRADDGSFTMTATMMDSIKRKYADFLTITDSTLVELDTFRYEGSFYVGIDSPLLLAPGRHTAWMALKSADYFNYLTFDCINVIQNYYDGQQFSFEIRKRWFDKFFELFYLLKLNEDEELNETDMKRMLIDWDLENRMNTDMAVPVEEMLEALEDCLEQ